MSRRIPLFVVALMFFASPAAAIDYDKSIRTPGHRVAYYLGEHTDTGKMITVAAVLDPDQPLTRSAIRAAAQGMKIRYDTRPYFYLKLYDHPDMLDINKIMNKPRGWEDQHYLYVISRRPMGSVFSGDRPGINQYPE